MKLLFSLDIFFWICFFQFNQKRDCLRIFLCLKVLVENVMVCLCVWFTVRFFELGSNCPVGQHGMHLSLKVDLGAKLF